MQSKRRGRSTSIERQGRSSTGCLDTKYVMKGLEETGCRTMKASRHCNLCLGLWQEKGGRGSCYPVISNRRRGHHAIWSHCYFRDTVRSPYRLPWRTLQSRPEHHEVGYVQHVDEASKLFHDASLPSRSVEAATGAITDRAAALPAKWEKIRPLSLLLSRWGHTEVVVD